MLNKGGAGAGFQLQTSGSFVAWRRTFAGEDFGLLDFGLLDFGLSCPEIGLQK